MRRTAPRKVTWCRVKRHPAYAHIAGTSAVGFMPYPSWRAWIKPARSQGEHPLCEFAAWQVAYSPPLVRDPPGSGVMTVSDEPAGPRPSSIFQHVHSSPKIASKEMGTMSQFSRCANSIRSI